MMLIIGFATIFLEILLITLAALISCFAANAQLPTIKPTSAYKVPNISTATYKSDKAWSENVRVKSLKVYCNGKPICIFELQNSRSLQTEIKIVAKKKLGGQPSLFLCLLQAKQIYLLSAVATSTAQATVQPTIGLLPMPRNPIMQYIML